MPRSQEEKKAKSAFGTAMGKQFASFYGTSVNDPEAWKALCEALGVDPVPETIAECRDVRVQSRFVPFVCVNTHTRARTAHQVHSCQPGRFYRYPYLRPTYQNL